jgi:hypothetical protein
VKPPPLVTLFSALLVSLGTAHCADESAGTYRRPKQWPKPTDPPPASPVYHDVREPVPDEAELAQAASEHYAKLEREIAQALEASDSDRLEAVIVYLLPELLQVEPERVLNLLARSGPGARGELFRHEVARLWIAQDPAAATRWLKSLEGEQRRAAVLTAVTELAPHEPARALQLAREFALDKDESLRQLLSGAPRH